MNLKEPKYFLYKLKRKYERQKSYTHRCFFGSQLDMALKALSADNLPEKERKDFAELALNIRQLSELERVRTEQRKINVELFEYVIDRLEKEKKTTWTIPELSKEFFLVFKHKGYLYHAFDEFSKAVNFGLIAQNALDVIGFVATGDERKGFEVYKFNM